MWNSHDSVPRDERAPVLYETPVLQLLKSMITPHFVHVEVHMSGRFTLRDWEWLRDTLHRFIKGGGRLLVWAILQSN